MTEPLDNPASRLKYWLGVLNQARGDEALSVVIARSLGLDHEVLDDRARSVETCAQIARICKQVRDEAGLLPEEADTDLTLEDFVAVEMAMDNMTMARSNAVQSITTVLANSRGLLSVDILERQLRRYRRGATVREDTREALLDAVKDLRRQAADLDDADLRDFVQSRFGDVEQALRDALIYGAGPIQTVTDSVVGSIERQPTMWGRLMESAVGGAVGQVVGALFLTLIIPPTPTALPTGTSQTVINNYTAIQINMPEDGIAPDVIEGIVVPNWQGPKALPAPQKAP